MNVTTGTLTKAIEALEQKGYVNRCRNDRDKRVVRVSLTDSGVRAYEHHARFHSNMIHDIKESLTDQESEILIGTLGKLVKFFQKKYESYLKNKKIVYLYKKRSGKREIKTVFYFFLIIKMNFSGTKLAKRRKSTQKYKVFDTNMKKTLRKNSFHTKIVVLMYI